MAHTPGPWGVLKHGSGEKWLYVNANGPFEIARVDIDDIADSQEAEVHANARLIAAAPELLAALQKIRDVWDFYAEHNRYPDATVTTCFDDWAADLADSAITKLEGK